jgi:hypothetical protein
MKIFEETEKLSAKRIEGFCDLEKNLMEETCGS